jgi:hypothetical protein
MFGGSNRGGAPTVKARLTINAGAFDLYTLIDRQAAEQWAAVTGRIPGLETTEAMMSRWAAAMQDVSPVTVTLPDTIDGPNGRKVVVWDRIIHTTAHNLAAGWVRQIEELLNPLPTGEIIAACIQCGVREVWRTVDGESIKSPAMMFIRDRVTGDSTEARCQACGTVWWPFQFKFLAEQIGINERATRAG